MTSSTFRRFSLLRSRRGAATAGVGAVVALLGAVWLGAFTGCFDGSGTGPLYIDGGVPCLNGTVGPGEVIDNSQTDCIDSLCVDGQLIPQNDDTEVPDDGYECTTDACVNGSKIFTPTPGASCGMTGTLMCNDLGQCEGCATASQCGVNTECQTWTCTANKTCQPNPKAQGTAVMNQTAGDCMVVQCNGVGGEETVVGDTDVPSDGNECTDDVCTMGTPSNPASSMTTTCSTGYCNGSGACVQCNDPTQCPGMDSFCHMRTCNAGVCGANNTMNGTALPTADQTAGDCKEVQCDGMGGTKTVNRNSDIPDDMNDCTNDICTMGTPSNTNKPLNDPCNSNGGDVCDGNGACKKSNGTTCGNNSECVDGSCTDSVCCNTACTAQCFSCNQANNLGTCSAVAKYDEDPNAMTPCTGMNACNGMGICLLKDGEVCGNNGECISGMCQGSGTKTCVP